MGDYTEETETNEDVLADLRSSEQDYMSAAGWSGEMPKADPIPREIRKRVETLRKEYKRGFARIPDILISKPLSDWFRFAAGPISHDQLFGPFWQKGELAILFAGTGIGKSVLATQIAESLARGVQPAAFHHTANLPVAAEKVLYLDFELNANQLSMRYSRCSPDGSKFDTPYEFSPDFIRSEFHWDGRSIEGYNGFSDMFFCDIANQIEVHGSTVLVVDNITFLDRKSLSNSYNALAIMRALNILKNTTSISILVLAHTAKRRASRPLTDFDLQGSINIANFADSIFAMGRSSTGADLRYLKQIKVRSGAMEYGDAHVPVFSLQKLDAAVSLGLVQKTERPPVENFLGFKCERFDEERNHLELRKTARSTGQYVSSIKRKNVALSVRELAKKGKSVRFIAEKLGVPKTTVARYMKAA